MKARGYGIWAGLAIVAAITSGALLAQAPQAIGTWVSVGDLSSPLTNGAAVALPDKRTLIAGGALGDGTLTDAVTIYDSVDDSATAAGTLTSARADHTATLLKDGRVLVVGGMTVDGLISSDIEIFDPATGTSAVVALLPEPRKGHVAAALPNGNVLIAGGAIVDGTVLQTAVLFDPETSGVSSVPGHLHTARVHASATTMLDGRVLVAGGSNGTTELASAEIYDRYSQSFSIAATQMSVGRQRHSAVLLPDNGGVLVAGGTSNGVAQAGVDLFLPAVFPDPFSYGEGEFTATGAMTAARSRAVAGPTSIEGYAFAAAGGAPDAEVYRFATIKTDKDDYAPGELATITGSGWQANEEVTLLFQEDPAVHDDYVLKVNADGNGNIFWNQWAPEQHDFGVRFFLTATDSKSKAQTTFTDGNKVTFSTSASGIEATDFGTATANQCVNAYVQERQGNSIDTGSHPARNVSLSSTPVGAAFFAGLNCVTSASVVTIPANTSAIAFSFKIASPSVSQYTINGDAGLNGSNNPSTTVTFPAQKTDQAITVTQGPPTTVSFGSTFNVAATASSNLPVTITTSGVCTGIGSNGSATITMTSGTGACTVHYNQTGNDSYNPAPEVTNATAAAKATQTISVNPPAPGSATYNATFDVAATATSTLPVAITTSDICSGSGSGSATITMTSGTGSCTVHYNQVGDANYDAAPEVTSATTAVKATQTISVNPAAPGSATYNTTFEVAATASSTLPVTITTSEVCSGTGSGSATITMTSGTGACTVHYNQAGDANYEAAPEVTNATTAVKATQTISVNPAAPGSATYNTTFEVAATASSTLPVAITTSEVCSGTGSGSATITMTSGTGACTVHYNQAGDANYEAAPEVTNATTALKATQTISVNPAAPGSATYNTTFDVAATANSTLPVAITTSDVCSGSGSGNATITMTSGTGACTVHYNQAGDANYDAAPEVTNATTALKATQTISVNPPAPGSATYNTTFEVAATASSTLPVAITTSEVCSGTGSGSATITMTSGTGSCTVHYNQAGDANYQAALEMTNSTTAVKVSSITTVSCPSGGVNYTGLPVTPCSATATGVNNVTLASSLVVNYTNNVDYGTATARAAFGGDQNYKESNATTTFAINSWWTTNGFFQPVDMSNGAIVWNTIKGGSTVPLKFNLWAGSVKKTSVNDVKGFLVFPMSCSASGITSEIEQDMTTTGGTTLRYDGTAGQFIQNWQTPKASNQCFGVRMTAKDGSTIEAYFKTK